MWNIIPSDERHHQDFGWLNARWHFSFGDYIDRNNISFGPLRVFNDDIIAPGGGFEPHPHQNMEIVTYVLSGALAHEDSMGHREVIRPGEVQVMSAGTGVVHSEFNGSKEEPVRLLQLWIMPRHKGAAPRWEQRGFPQSDRTNRLLPVVSSGEEPGTLAIDQDATIYVSKLTAGHVVTHATSPGRRLYLFVATGAVTANGRDIAAGDQARIENETTLDIQAENESEIILLDLP